MLFNELYREEIPLIKIGLGLMIGENKIMRAKEFAIKWCAEVGALMQ